MWHAGERLTMSRSDGAHIRDGQGQRAGAYLLDKVMVYYAIAFWRRA
jgi:hypothetical protein